MSDLNVDSNAIVNDLLDQIKQLIAANTVLRVNVNTSLERIEVLEAELKKAVHEAQRATPPQMQTDD